LKSYDSLVAEVGDLELSKHWGAAWPDGARQASETEKRPVYSFKDYAHFLDRFSVLVKGDMDELRGLLAE